LGITGRAWNRHAHSCPLLTYFMKWSLCGSTLQIRSFYMNHTLLCMIECFLVILHVSASSECNTFII
jgi:hypothetical protein